MITQLVSNIGILARHGTFSTGLFTSRTTPHRYMLEYIHGGVVTSESLLIFTHSEKMTVSIIPHSFHIIGFVVCLYFAHPCFTKPLLKTHSATMTMSSYTWGPRWLER